LAIGPENDTTNNNPAAPHPIKTARKLLRKASLRTPLLFPLNCFLFKKYLYEKGVSR
jgi:hypothetical protein